MHFSERCVGNSLTNMSPFIGLRQGPMGRSPHGTFFFIIFEPFSIRFRKYLKLQKIGVEMLVDFALVAA